MINTLSVYLYKVLFSISIVKGVVRSSSPLIYILISVPSTTVAIWIHSSRFIEELVPTVWWAGYCELYSIDILPLSIAAPFCFREYTPYSSPFVNTAPSFLKTLSLKNAEIENWFSLTSKVDECGTRTKSPFPSRIQAEFSLPNLSAVKLASPFGVPWFSFPLSSWKLLLKG